MCSKDYLNRGERDDFELTHTGVTTYYKVYIVVRYVQLIVFIKEYLINSVFNKHIMNTP